MSKVKAYHPDKPEGVSVSPDHAESLLQRKGWTSKPDKGGGKKAPPPVTSITNQEQDTDAVNTSPSSSLNTDANIGEGTAPIQSDSVVQGDPA